MTRDQSNQENSWEGLLGTQRLYVALDGIEAHDDRAGGRKSEVGGRAGGLAGV